MSSQLQEKLEGSGFADLWRRRAEGLQERRLLERQLGEVASEISFFDRLIFFHTTEEEAKEQRVKERLKDLAVLIAETTAEIDEFWFELCEKSPDLERVRNLEEVLRRALVAHKPHEIKFASDACRLLLEKALQALGDRLPKEEIEPEQAVGQVFTEPAQAYLIPLAALGSLLELAGPITEATWEGSRESLFCRPVLIRLVGKVMAAFRRTEPDNPFPFDIVTGWLERGHPATRLPQIPEVLAGVYPSGESEQALSELEELLEKLAGHDLALRLTRREISLFDRIVFWSDTPAEARERILVGDRTALCEEVTSRWLDLERQLRARRRELWEVYVADQTLAVRDALRNISTADGESSRPMTCPLMNQEQAIWQSQSFANETSQRFGPAWDREALLREALSMPAGAPPQPGKNGFVESAQLPQLLGPVLKHRGFDARHRAMVESIAKAELNKDQLRDAKSQISTWDRINVFKETEAEAREKAMVAAVSEDGERIIGLESEMQRELDGILQEVHKPALVGLLVGELGRAVESVRAECASTTRSYEDSDGATHYETVYYCVLRGLTEVGDLLLRLMACGRMGEGSYLPLWEAAEVWALLDSGQAHSIQALSLSENS